MRSETIIFVLFSSHEGDQELFFLCKTIKLHSKQSKQQKYIKLFIDLFVFVFAISLGFESRAEWRTC